ncbi:hypothetical protein [Halalkalibacter urbisdiaboli]|uniref:hypothetical protein n=1 Tax=Halalkalibacter urbisdiaboli TaxID=1960589 RepID=UPI000B4368B9|nr:hypothetical protein [Halalkalibacter urbisdiaboli]
MEKSRHLRSLKHDSPIQLQQKIIHYRSEVTRHKNLLEDVEKELEYYKRLYAHLKESVNTNEKDSRKQIVEEAIAAQAHFTYSTILPQLEEDEKNVDVIGNLVLKNIGNKALTTPIICLRVTPSESGNLSGKIKLYPSKRENEGEQIVEEIASEDWQYVHDNWRERVKEDGEHWLRPLHQTQIDPGDQISFSNFNLTLSPSEAGNSIVVNGFVYFQELQEGVPALNQIIINY